MKLFNLELNFTCSAFRNINALNVLLKNEDNSGLSGGSCFMKSYNLFKVFSSATRQLYKGGTSLKYN